MDGIHTQLETVQNKKYIGNMIYYSTHKREKKIVTRIYQTIDTSHFSKIYHITVSFIK